MKSLTRPSNLSQIRVSFFLGADRPRDRQDDLGQGPHLELLEPAQGREVPRCRHCRSGFGVGGDHRLSGLNAVHGIGKVAHSEGSEVHRISLLLSPFSACSWDLYKGSKVVDQRDFSAVTFDCQSHDILHPVIRFAQDVVHLQLL